MGAYLMIKKNFSLREAFELVRQKRLNIGPRSNFMTELCKLERELIPEKNNDFVYSLPMQVYELSSMRCVKYEDSMQFLLAPKKQTRLGRVVQCFGQLFDFFFRSRFFFGNKNFISS